MIRKSIIVLLTFAAAVFGCMWLLSYMPFPNGYISQAGPFRISAGPGFWYVATTTNERPHAGLWMRGKRGRLEFTRHRRIRLRNMTSGYTYDVAGFGFTRGFKISHHAGSATEYTTIAVLAWAPFVIFALYPVIRLFRDPLNRYRRCKQGLCANCGYNLTGNESGTCPECGSEIQA